MNFTVLNFIPAQIAGRRCSELSFSSWSDSVPTRAVGPSHPTALGSLACKPATALLASWGPGAHMRGTAVCVPSGVTVALLSRAGKWQLR